MLTDEEHTLIAMLGEFGHRFSHLIVGPYADQDLAIVAQHLSALQFMVMSHAAARAHPDRGYTLLGGLPAEPPATEPTVPWLADDARRGDGPPFHQRPLEGSESAP